MRSIQVPVLVALLSVTSACSGLKPRSSAAEVDVLKRGWAYVEPTKELLKQETGGGDVNFTSAALVGNRLIYGSARFGLIAMNKDTGRVLWRRDIPGGIYANVLAQENRLYVGGEDGFFRVFSLDTGEELWKSDLRFPIVGTPAAAQGRVVVGTIDHAVHALDAATGKVLWTFRRGATATTTIKGGGNAAFINGKFWVGFADGTLVALDPNDGAVSLEKQFLDNPKFTDVDATPVPWKRGVLVVSYDGRLRNLRLDGTLQWMFPAGGAHSPIPTQLNGGTIFLAASDGYVYAIQDGTAKEVWKFALKKGIPTGMALFSEGDKHTLAVASSDNFVYALDATTGKLLNSESLGSSSGTYGDLVSDGAKSGRFYLVSHYGRVYQFRVQR